MAEVFIDGREEFKRMAEAASKKATPKKTTTTKKVEDK